MGSGSSSEAPKETKSAPASSRAESKPKRNRQFEEVQIAKEGGNNPRSRQQARSQGASPNPPAKSTRGQDPGASGSTSDRGKQQSTPRQGAAANGKKPQTSDMPSQKGKNINSAAGTSELHNRNQVNVGHGKLSNQVQARENALAMFNTDKTEQKKNEKGKHTADDKKMSGKVNGTTKTEAEQANNKQPATTVKQSSTAAGKQKQESSRNFERTTDQAVSNPGNNEVDSINVGDQNQRKEAAGTEKGAVKTNIQAQGAVNGNIHNEELELDGDNLSFDQGDDLDESHVHDNDHDDDIDSEDEGHEDSFFDHHDEDTEPPASKRRKQKTDKVETMSMKDDDIVFETFYHRSGKEFQCIYQSGMRFYLDDWGSKEWQPFPKRWYNEGLLVTNTILKDENAAQNNDQNAGASGQGQSRSQGRSQGQGQGGSGDDREGFLMHPTKGRVPTYIFYKKHNVHMYFDRDTGSWVRMPIGWELHHNMVKSLVDQVEEAVPTWGDRHDILALLRACNYDPDECISIYLHLQKDEWMKGPKTSKENKVLEEKENKIIELEKRVRHLEIQLQKEITARQDAERNLEEQMTKFTDLEADQKETEAQLSAVTGGRPETARPFSRMVKGGKGGRGTAMGAAAGKGGKQVKAGEVVNPDDVLDLNANAKELRKVHTRVKMDVERFMGDMKHIIGQLTPAMNQLKKSEKGTMAEIEEVRALYRKEALQRKLLYNQLQELRGNIRVFCRVRKDDKAENCLKFPSDQDIVCVSQQGKKMFNFDKVFDPSATQEAIFEDTKPIITSCADGYNVCLLAYGQTGSGKTFTMMGPDSNPGINIRAMKELFQVCADRKETMSYTLVVSLVEIYNETIQDLLTSDVKHLELRTAGNKVQIPGLTEYPIQNLDDVKKVMAMGDQNRSVASTKMNSTSSRSHLVLMLAVEGTDKVTSAITRGTLVLCDLAGSERISKTEAEGQRLIEAAAINKSLSALGQVFTALRSSQLHVPYRNSKLTQILQPSLGGDAKACLFVNVSPDSYNYAETVSTLTFGSNARQVALGQAKQNITKGK